MTAARIAQVVGAFLFAILMYTSFAVADQTVSAVDTDGSDDLTPPGVAFLYAKTTAILRSSDCKYYTWSHTPGASYAGPSPWDWEWDSYNAGDYTWEEGWTETWLTKNGFPYVYKARAALPDQPEEPPCYT